MYSIDSKYKWDTDRQWQQMSDSVPWAHRVAPRRSRYGDDHAASIGLTTFDAVLEETPDVLIPWDKMKDAIEHAHAEKLMPMYHQDRLWAPVDTFQYTQGRLGYCWTWSGTAAVMDVMALEDREDFKLLAPVSMGYLVGWRNEGNYLESFIKGARENGICPAVNGDINSHENSSSYWAQHNKERLPYRLDEVWDVDARSGDQKTMQQVVSHLCLGLPGYGAWNWWGHAVEIVGVLWTPNEYMSMTLLLRNSHNEKSLRALTGSRMVPDEDYAFRSTRRYVESRDGSGLYVPASAA